MSQLLGLPSITGARLVFVRHGESTFAQSGRYTGSTDIPLTAFGKKQAFETGSWLSQHYPPAKILCSPLIRTRETLDCLFDGAGVGHTQQTLVQPVMDPRLVEICYGSWEGQTRNEILDKEGDLYRTWELDPVQWAAGTSGETATEVRDRVLDALRENAAPDGTTWIVTHRTVMRIMMATLLQTPLKEYRSRYDQFLASINILHRVPERWQLELANATPWKA